MVEERNGCLCFDGYTLVKESLDCVPMNGKAVVNTISPNSYGISQKDSDMDKALKGSDYLILDGVYFGLWPLLRYGKKARRITGWDSFIYYLERMQEVGGKVFLLGSTPETLRKMTSRILVEYPAVQVDSYSPPFKPEFDQDDNRKMIEAVNSFSPDILVVGMTAPKQEKWAYFNMPFLHAHVSIAVGNVFDWYAGNTRRPGKFWQKAGLEWFVRIFYRPEIFKRNISNQMVFFRHLALKLLRIKK